MVNIKDRKFREIYRLIARWMDIDKAGEWTCNLLYKYLFNTKLGDKSLCYESIDHICRLLLKKYTNILNLLTVLNCVLNRNLERVKI